MIMSKVRFKILPHNHFDKDIEVVGPLFMRVDYDDVDHESTSEDIQKMVRILNKHWDKE